jgi:ADP-ribose pyrophosphatase YjhB (NUDIX family)
VCTGCAHIHYESPQVLALCMAHTDERLLLCRRANEPARGLWSPPAGFLEVGENLEEAAARETWEETGVTVDPGELKLGFVASLPHLNQIYIGYRAFLPAQPKAVAGPESLEVRFCSREELPWAEMAFGRCMTGYYHAFFKQLLAGQFQVMRMQMRRNGAAGVAGKDLFSHEPFITYE